MVGRPTVTIPFCILFNTVIPDTVEIIVNVFHLDRTGYIIPSVKPSSSPVRCAWSIVACPERIRASSIPAVVVGAKDPLVVIVNLGLSLSEA